AIISGSVAVASMVDLEFEPNDLDIYVPEDGEQFMSRALTEEQGFYLDTTSNIHYPQHIGIIKIHWYRKGRYVINLVVVHGNNALTAIFKFHSTVVMNFISFYGRFSAYGDLTEKNIGVINPAFLAEGVTRTRTMECVEKYRQRGFDIRLDVRQ
ncbi:hypothetical protein B0H11DRAFT_1677197, partial [Mycena galericulata]